MMESASWDATRLFIEHLHTAGGLWRRDRWTRERLARFRDRKLRVLAAHAHRRVPFYRRVFDAAGVAPGDVRGAADLVRLPITTKATLRRCPEAERLAGGRRGDRLLSTYTTGSTGEATRVLRGAGEDYLLRLFRLRTGRLFGERWRDRKLAVRSPGVRSNRGRRSLARLQSALGVLRADRVDCLQPIERIAGEVCRFAPDVLVGYATVLGELATLWPERRGTVANPRLVVAAGETLTPATRRRIAAGFAAPVVDLYGCTEVGVIGWQCAATGDFHLCDDNVVVEVVRDGRPVAPGESGDVVITSLHGYAAPYLRYDLGDVATRGDERCRCGAPFSTLRNLHGRRMDYCVLPDGRKMHHWELIPMRFWDMPWHRRYQLEQQTAERFVLRLIADQPPPDADLAALSASIQHKLGPRAELRIELVDDAAFAATPKHVVCRSALAAADEAAG